MKLNVPFQQLDETAYDRLLEGGQLIEQDSFGPKVYELTHARMLKLFRVKRLLSSNLWSPYAQRFAKNALRLRDLQIPSVTCQAWGRVPHLERQFVLYERLPGTPIRACEALDPNQLGRFFAHLHDHGIYFRSCHLGNLLQLDSGEIGLIDILDLRFRRGPLTDRDRERNFCHLRRLPQDRERLQPIWEDFLEAYTRG